MRQRFVAAGPGDKAWAVCVAIMCACYLLVLVAAYVAGRLYWA